MSDPQEIRAQIEECRQELARAEGEESTLQAEIDGALANLRTTLDCKAGKEQAAIKKLKASIAEDEAELERLLEEAEVE